LKERLPLPPTTSRDFDRRDSLVVVAEVYDNRTKDVDPMDLVTTIADSGGTVMFRARERIDGFAFEPRENRGRIGSNYRSRTWLPGHTCFVLRPGHGSRNLYHKPQGALLDAIAIGDNIVTG
jgi:hypothetical protein